MQLIALNENSVGFCLYGYGRMYGVYMVMGEGGGQGGLEWGWGLNKEAAVQDLPGLGIKEGAAISTTSTLET